MQDCDTPVGLKPDMSGYTCSDVQKCLEELIQKNTARLHSSVSDVYDTVYDLATDLEMRVVAPPEMLKVITEISNSADSRVEKLDSMCRYVESLDSMVERLGDMILMLSDIRTRYHNLLTSVQISEGSLPARPLVGGRDRDDTSIPCTAADTVKHSMAEWKFSRVDYSTNSESMEFTNFKYYLQPDVNIPQSMAAVAFELSFDNPAIVILFAGITATNNRPVGYVSLTKNWKLHAYGRYDGPYTRITMCDVSNLSNFIIVTLSGGSIINVRRRPAPSASCITPTDIRSYPLSFERVVDIARSIG